MLRHSIATPKVLTEISAAAKHGGAPLTLYQSVRLTSHLKTHERLTYSNIGTSRVRKPIVDHRYLKWGEPVSSSVMLGDMTEARKFKFDAESLNARGFLRFQKPYTPPANATEKVLEICRSCLNVSGNEQALIGTKLDDSRLKYEVLTKTFEHFQHAIPNSMLHMMETVGDVVEFYCIRVNTRTPYEELIRNPELPPNLHIQKEPLRFHPDTDTLFGGETAFTKSSTIVTGLRSKKKYRGYEAKMTWP